MTSNESTRPAKSFDEFKSAYFPLLSQHESHNIAKLGFGQVGANMADEAFNSLLGSKSNKT
jgi:hypothetical protein